MASRILLTLNLRKYLSTQPRNKRARKAVDYVRDRVAHYTKTDLENVRLSQDLNSLIVRKFSRKMVPIKLNVKMDGGKAVAEPFAQEREKPQVQGAAKKEEKKAQPAAKEGKPADAKSK